MNAKPKEAIERIRNELTACVSPRTGMTLYSAQTAILAYLDSIPADAVPVVWPAELTRERLEALADEWRVQFAEPCKALLALAAIAPQKKKRVVNLWQHVADDLPVCRHPKWQPDPALACNWTLIKRNVELED